jgi:hypothetical protein
MDLTIAKVQEFLPSLTPPEKASVTAWLTAINARFTQRYGARITLALEPVFVSYAADAVKRRLDKQRTGGGQMIESQTTGPFGVRFSARASLGGWFLPEEVSDMDETVGMGGIQTHRMAAPDGIRYGNLSRHHDVEDWEDGD